MTESGRCASLFDTLAILEAKVTALHRRVVTDTARLAEEMQRLERLVAALASQVAASFPDEDDVR